MRLYYLEIKRILSGKFTRVAIILAIVLSFLAAYIPTTFVYYIEEESLNEITGLKAISKKKEALSKIEGNVDQETIEYAVLKYQETISKYDVSNEYSLPKEGRKEIDKIKPLLHLIREAYCESNGIAAEVINLNGENLPEFYDACIEHMENDMQLEYKNNLFIQKKGNEMYLRVDKPFYYSYGISFDAIEYEDLLIVLLLFCTTVICAPIFSTEYQTGSDNILRCTKNGRKTLAVVKILASVSLSFALSLLGVSIFIIESLVLWGFEGMKTSIQILASAISLLNTNAIETMIVIAVLSIIMIISSTLLTLFVSSQTHNTMVSMAVSFVIVLLPLMISWFIPDNVANVLKCIFPSGGIGLNNGILFDLIDLKFIAINRFVIWTPYLIMFLSIIEIPIWFFLTMRSYETHISK